MRAKGEMCVAKGYDWEKNGRIRGYTPSEMVLPLGMPHKSNSLESRRGILLSPKCGAQISSREDQWHEIPLATQVSPTEPIGWVGLGVHPAEPWAKIDTSDCSACKPNDGVC